MYIAQSAHTQQKQRLARAARTVSGNRTLPATSDGIARYVFAQLTREEEKACEMATD